MEANLSYMEKKKEEGEGAGGLREDQVRPDLFVSSLPLYSDFFIFAVFCLQRALYSQKTVYSGGSP